MDQLIATDLQKLADLRAAGAITADQYDRLAAPLLERAGQAKAHSRGPERPEPDKPQQSPSLLRVAGAAGAGAITGTLAADLLQGAIADPPPEVLEANFSVMTTFTEDGYVSEGNITWANADGEVMAQGTYIEEGDWQDSPSEYESDVSTVETGDDFGLMEF